MQLEQTRLACHNPLRIIVLGRISYYHPVPEMISKLAVNYFSFFDVFMLFHFASVVANCPETDIGCKIIN